MSDQTEDVQQSIQVLKLAYASSLPEKIDEIEHALDVSLEVVAALSHKLAGTAGMYGFLALSETASKLESICDLILNRDAGPGENDLRKIAELIESLQQQVRADCGVSEALVQPDNEQP